jgi:hypothetical protein
MSHNAHCTPEVREAIRQLAAQTGRGVKRGFLCDPERPMWVRATLRHAGRTRNVDVTYVPGRDTYDVQVHDLANAVDVTTREFTDVYAEDLGGLMALPWDGEDRRWFEPRAIRIVATVSDWHEGVA